MGHHIDRRIHSKGGQQMEGMLGRGSVGELLNENHELIPKRAVPPTTTVVLTVIEAVLPNGSTAAQFTVPTLPATVSHSRLGVVTIPAGSMSPIIVSSLPPPQTKVPATSAHLSPTNSPVSVSQPPPSQPSKPSTNVSLPSSQNSLPSSQNSLPSTNNSLPSTNNSLPSSHPSQPSTDISTPSTVPATPSASTSVLPAPSSKSSISSNTESSAVSSAPASSISSTAQSSLPTTTSGSIPSSSQISSTTSSLSTSLSSSSTNLSSSSSSSTSLSSISSTSTSSTSGYIPGGGGGATGEPPVPTQTNGNTPKASSSDDVPKIVGGVLGGVGAIALAIILLLLLRRIRKRKAVRESHLTSKIVSSGASAGRNTFSTSDTSQLSGSVLGGATRVFDRFRNSSSSMAAEAAPAQRGFQKIGGRKLTSVLETGGDGYDDKFGTDEKRLIASPERAGFGKETGSRSAAAAGGDSSFGAGLHKELGLGQQLSRSPPTSAMAMDRPLSDESTYSERVAFRPSPARTPVATPIESAMRGGISTTPQSGIVAPSEPLPSIIPPSVRDGIGRSLAAADGSRASRFTEGV
ncbi:A-agglutinin anchorage subunit [Arthroderma uncinatum]|uniref:A-agglutinin anchorage subunit n=1 Tax=Arthroderma uncinatum TaxID=74035 RepID=UPI00144A7DAB|nr:A-agglutinin anchorage subunit [Arthroderma uncinatum]KAF3491717.1 A-agglutinin anchorage subunit [Arthroderma uncinatum]